MVSYCIESQFQQHKHTTHIRIAIENFVQAVKIVIRLIRIMGNNNVKIPADRIYDLPGYPLIVFLSGRIFKYAYMRRCWFRIKCNLPASIELLSVTRTRRIYLTEIRHIQQKPRFQYVHLTKTRTARYTPQRQDCSTDGQNKNDNRR